MVETNAAAFLGSLLVIFVSAKLFGEAAVRLGQPAVLGELLGGVVLGFGSLPFLRPDDPALGLMAEFGVVLLLFQTGIQSDLRGLLSVGSTSVAVASVGVAAPFLLGWAFLSLLGAPPMAAVLVGAALTATSVGITARVLYDSDALASREGQIILGAAVIDDVLGLIILSAVQGVVAQGRLSWPGVALNAALSAAFLAAALSFGPLLSKRLVALVPRMRVRGVLIVAALGFAFALALAAHAAGSALIVGAFMAGALLADTDRKEDIDGALQPVADVFVPVFFVMVGARVDLGAYNPLAPGSLAALGLAAGLVVAGCLGKIASGWAARERGLDRLGIGLGMIPRGEVGLIFAQVGLSSGAIDGSLYGVVVGVVVATTVLGPPLLDRRLRVSGGRARSSCRA